MRVLRELLEAAAGRPRPEPVRVLFVHPFGKAGGAENVLLSLLGELDRERVEPFVVLMEPGPFADQVAAAGVGVRVLGLRGKRAVARFPFAARRLARELRPLGFEVLHANGTKAALFGNPLSQNLGIPMLWMKHGHDYDSWAPRLIGPGCARVACVSRAVASAFPDSISGRVFVCTPGVELHRAPPVSGSEPLVVSAGRIDPLKGFDELVRAVGLLRGRGVPASMEIAGPPNPKSPRHVAELERLIAELDLGDSVSLLGHLSSLSELYGRSRVVAIASRHKSGRAAESTGVEGTPLVLLEGMSFGRPVVGPDDPGIAEIVGDAGTLVERAAAPELAAALEPYLTDPGLAEAVGARGRERVRRSYTIGKMTERLTTEYEQLADPSRDRTASDASAPPAKRGFESSQRIAKNTAARWTGELLAKLASVAFYVVMARELGSSDFGSFIFALSLSSVVLIGAGFGLDQLLAREVSRDRERLRELLANVLALKSLMLVGLLGALVGVLALGPYSNEVRLAAALIGFGVGVEMLTQTLHAVTQAYERMELGAIGLVAQRGITALVGIAVLLGGGGLLAAAVVFALGSLAGYAISDLTMRRAVRPGLALDRASWMPLVRAGAPIGAATLLFTVLLRLDASLISFLTGGDQAEVGFYGAAYRLIDATLFTGIAFSAAMLPWISRHRSDSSPFLARGAAVGFKLLTAALLPIGLAYIVFAPELIDLLYGPEYRASIEVTRLLGAMTLLYGLNWYASNLLIARNRPGVFARAIAVTVVVNVALNLFLIPARGAEGAALAALITGLGLAVWSVSLVRRTLQGVSLPRSFASPALAGAAFAAVALLAPLPPLAAAAAGLVLYLGVLAGMERALYAADYALVTGGAARALRGLRS